MNGGRNRRAGALDIGYAAALTTSALCVSTVLWTFGIAAWRGGAVDVGALIRLLFIALAPGTLTLIAAAALAARGTPAPPVLQWATIAGAAWAAFLTWSFLGR